MFGGLNRKGSKSMGGLINLQKIGPKAEEPLKSDPSNFDDTNGGQINISRVMSPKTQSRIKFNSMSPDFVSLEKTPHFTTYASPEKN